MKKFLKRNSLSKEMKLNPDYKNNFMQKEEVQDNFTFTNAK